MKNILELAEYAGICRDCGYIELYTEAACDHQTRKFKNIFACIKCASLNGQMEFLDKKVDAGKALHAPVVLDIVTPSGYDTTAQLSSNTRAAGPALGIL